MVFVRPKKVDHGSAADESSPKWGYSVQHGREWPTLHALNGVHEGTSFPVNGVIAQSPLNISHGVGLKRRVRAHMITLV